MISDNQLLIIYSLQELLLIVTIVSKTITTICRTDKNMEYKIIALYRENRMNKINLKNPL